MYLQEKATIKLVAKAPDLQNNIYYFDVSVNLLNNSVLLIYIAYILFPKLHVQFLNHKRVLNSKHFN